MDEPWANGTGYLQCTHRSHHIEVLTPALIREYQEHGWPLCCGMPMEWVTATGRTEVGEWPSVE